MNKTIFFSIYGGDTEKVFLRSGVLDHLVKKNLKVILLIRAEKGSKKIKYYKENFSSHNVVVEAIPPAMTKFELFMYHISWWTLPTYSSLVKKHDLFLENKKLFRYIVARFAGFMGRFRLWREIIRLLYYWLPDNYAQDLFEKYKPTLLFAPNMFGAEDCRLLRYAKKLGIKTITVTKSWDVPTTRGFTRVRANKIMVFNNINKREIINIGDYKEDDVIVIGFPQFDFYTKKDIYISREEFIKNIGGDPNKKLIMYAIPGEFKHAYSHEILKALDDAIENGDFTSPVQILARFHPKYPSRAEELKDLKHVIFDRPGTYFSYDMERGIDAPSSTTFQWTFTNKDIIHLANSLYHSDVVINVESTITLDAVSIDRPVVFIGFDGNRNLDYWHSVIRNYDREHLQEVIQTNGVKFAKSFEELVENINRYLVDPNEDHKERELLRSNLMYRSDGKSAERVAKAIIKMV